MKFWFMGTFIYNDREVEDGKLQCKVGYVGEVTQLTTSCHHRRNLILNINTFSIVLHSVMLNI